MKIWLTGDLHHNKMQFNYLYQHQAHYDVLCLSGDLLNVKNNDFQSQTQWVADFLLQFDKPLLIASGNHDYDDLCECDWLLNITKQNIYVDEKKIVINDISFGVSPYMAPDYQCFDDCDILLTHVPPAGTQTSQEEKAGSVSDWGDFELQTLLEQQILKPHYVLCGHVERPLAKIDKIHNTVIINPGANHRNDEPEIYELKL